MKNIRYWAIASLFAPLGLVASACHQDPTELPEPDEDVAGPEQSAEEPGQDQEDLTEADPQSLPTAPVCRERGWSCYRDWECCSRECYRGVCTGWGGGGGDCRHRGEWCRADWQCCSGECWRGTCVRDRY